MHSTSFLCSGTNIILLIVVVFVVCIGIDAVDCIGIDAAVNCVGIDAARQSRTYVVVVG